MNMVAVSLVVVSSALTLTPAPSERGLQTNPRGSCEIFCPAGCDPNVSAPAPNACTVVVRSTTDKKNCEQAWEENVASFGGKCSMIWAPLLSTE